MDQNFFVTPFAALGDQTTFPIVTDPGGSVTFQQGWGPDYQLDQTTDPSAKDIDRATMNWLFFIITKAIAALQATGIPEWITAANNNGSAYPYAKYAQVRYSATTPGVVFETYVSTVDNNTDTPGTSNKWQPIASIVAANADVVAGTSTRLIVTPSSLKAYPGNASQTFDVATATASTNATPLLQVQNMRGTFNGTQSLNATATLTAAIVGEYIRWTGAAGTLTLPSVTSVLLTNIGTPAVVFKNDGTGALTIAAGAGDSITVANGASVTSITMQPGDDLRIAWPGTANTINAISGAALRQFNPLVIGAATGANHAVRLGQFETIAQYSVTQTGTLGNPISATTYTPTNQVITFPSFSKTGAFRVVAQLVASIFSTTGNVESQFQNALYDGTTVVGSGGNWSIYKKNSGYGGQTADTFISSTTYAPGATVTFTQRVICNVLEDPQFSIQSCFMRLWVIEA